MILHNRRLHKRLSTKLKSHFPKQAVVEENIEQFVMQIITIVRYQIPLAPFTVIKSSRSWRATVLPMKSNVRSVQFRFFIGADVRAYPCT